MVQLRVKLSLVSRALTVVVLVALPAAADDWIGFRGDASRTGRKGDAPLPDGFRVAWIFSAAEHYAKPHIDSSPAISGGSIFVGLAELSTFSTGGYVLCLDLSSGKVRWQHKTQFPVFSSPAVVSGRVFIGEGYHQDANCRLWCLDATSGKPIWHFESKSHIESSPFVAREQVYFGAGADGVYCLRANDGGVVWHFADEHVDTSPLVTSGFLFCGTGYGEFSAICLSARDGKPRWRTPFDLPVWGAPVRVGGRVYFGLGNGSLVSSDENPRGAVVCLSAVSGKLIWRRDVPDAVLSALSHASGKLFCTSRDGNVYALSPAQGTVLWKRSLGAPVVTSPLVGERALIAVSDAGRVAQLALESGEVLSEEELGKDIRVLSSPAAAAGRVVLGAGNRIIAYGGQTKRVAEQDVVRFDRDKRTVTVEAAACEADVYPQLKGAVEYLLVAKGGKAYEGLFETGATPEEVRSAFLALRLPPGSPAEDDRLPRGAPFLIWIEYDKDGKTKRRPADEFVLHAKRGRSLRPAAWAYTDSAPGVNPESGRKWRQCMATKSLVGLHFTDASPLLQNSREEGRTENIYKANKEALLPAGTAVHFVSRRWCPNRP